MKCEYKDTFFPLHATIWEKSKRETMSCPDSGVGNLVPLPLLALSRPTTDVIMSGILILSEPFPNVRIYCDSRYGKGRGMANKQQKNLATCHEFYFCFQHGLHGGYDFMWFCPKDKTTVNGLGSPLHPCLPSEPSRGPVRFKVAQPWTWCVSLLARFSDVFLRAT